MAVDDDRHRGVFGGIEAASQVFEFVDGVTVYGADHVTGLQAGGARRCPGVHGADFDGSFDLGGTDRGVHAEEDQHRQRQVEGGSGNDDDEPLPEWTRIEAPRAGVHATVHPSQLDEATERDGPDRIEGLATLPAEELGAESHTELLHLDPGQLGADEVPRLMHDDEQAEDEDDQRDEDHRAHAGSLLRSRLLPSPEARTWSRAQRSAAITLSRLKSSAGPAASTRRATDGMISTKRRWPFRKRATASSLAAFSTAGAMPARSPASRASATAG